MKKQGRVVTKTTRELQTEAAYEIKTKYEMALEVSNGDRPKQTNSTEHISQNMK